jgi:hypothetical protein
MSDTHSTGSSAISENNEDYFREHPETTQWLFRRMLNKFIPSAKTPYEVVAGINKLCDENNTPNVNKLVDYSSSSDSDDYSSSEFSDEELLLRQVPQKPSVDNDSDSESSTSSDYSESSTSSDYSDDNRIDNRIDNVKQIGSPFKLLFVMFVWCSITLFLTAQSVDLFRHLFLLQLMFNADAFTVFMLSSFAVLYAYYRFTQYVSSISANNFVCVVTMFICTLMCSFWATAVLGSAALKLTTPVLKSVLFVV